MELLMLVLRVGLSLAAVLGLLWWLSRRMRATASTRRREGLGLAVVNRQQLSKRSGVAMVEAAGRRLVVGYTDQGITLLHDAGDIPVEDIAAPSGAQRMEVDIADLNAAAIADRDVAVPELRVVDADLAAVPVPDRSTSARTADARRPRTPLEGSILAPTTWRQAVATVQERTVRRP